MGPFRQGKPLKLPTPELDAYEAELRARSHRKVTYAGIGVVVLTLPLLALLFQAIVPDLVYKVQNPLHTPSPAVVESGRATITRLRESAAREEEAMQKGVAAAAANGTEAHPELGRCPYSHTANHEKGFFARATYARLGDQSVCLPCREQRARADELERKLGERSRAKDLDARVSAEIARAEAVERYSVVLAVDKEAAPHGTPHVDFMPGLVEGRTFVWDTKTHAVVCAGRARAESSDTIDYSYTTQNGFATNAASELKRALDEDLRLRTEEAVASSIRYRAGPKIVD